MACKKIFVKLCVFVTLWQKIVLSKENRQIIKLPN